MSDDSGEGWKRCRDQDQGSVSTYEKEKTTDTNISTIIFVLQHHLQHLIIGFGMSIANPFSYIGHWRNNCPMEEILENEP